MRRAFLCDSAWIVLIGVAIPFFGQTSLSGNTCSEKQTAARFARERIWPICRRTASTPTNSCFLLADIMISGKESEHENPIEAVDFTAVVDWNDDVGWHRVHSVDTTVLRPKRRRAVVVCSLGQAGLGLPHVLLHLELSWYSTGLGCAGGNELPKTLQGVPFLFWLSLDGIDCRGAEAGSGTPARAEFLLRLLDIRGSYCLACIPRAV